MSLVLPIAPEEKPRLPYLILYEINTILDDSQPYSKRVALLLKWSRFLHAIYHDLPVPRPEELDPGGLREHALRLAEAVALLFTKPGVSQNA